MNSREQGYEDERFENDVSQNFHCPICMNVFKDPVMCQRNQHNFCRPCISRHLQNSQRCPCCQEELALETLNRAPRIMTDYLSELNIRCDYLSRGCREIVQLGDLEIHVKDCGFTPVLCANEGCVVELNKRDRIHHETEECEFRKVKCHDCFEIRKEVDEVKMNLMAVNEKLDRMEENIHTDIKNIQEQMKTDLENKMENLKEDLEHKFNQLVMGNPENYTNNMKPSVVVAGGQKDNSSTLRSAEIFEWSMGTWSLLQPMKECRQGASSFVYKDHLTVAGGWTDGGMTDSMERININPIMDSTQWSDFPAKLPSTLMRHNSVVYNERLITIGGYDGCTHIHSDSIHEVLLDQPYTRSLVSRMPQPRCSHGAQLFNDKICIVGGRKTGSPKDSVASVLMFDINKKECKGMAPLPFAVCDMATVRWGDNVIVLGGVDQDGKVLNTVVIYNVEIGKNHMLPEMKCNRYGCAAVVSQGNIVVMGGTDESRNILNSVECFSFDRYSWEDLPPMREARVRAKAVAW